MVIEKGMKDNYQYMDYIFEKTTVRYIVMNDTEGTFMLMIPNGVTDLINDTFKTVKISDDGFPDNRDWFVGSLVHLHLSHHCTPVYNNSLKFSESTRKLKYDGQSIVEEDEFECIKTYLKSDEGYYVIHELTHFHGENGFEVKSTFVNKTGEKVTLEMLTSAALDNLSPFMNDDGSEDLTYHYFKGGWATEGKHIQRRLSDMNMEKSWGGSFESEKIGVIGSKPVGRYYPYAALEDTRHGCIWGIKLKHNATWQIELSRYGTPLSLSTGIGDINFGAWRKTIENRESFQSPTAYVSVAKGGIDEVSNDLIKMNDRDIERYGEKGMPIIFNDWVTHWGDTSLDKLISIADKMKDSKVKYFVVDDGWQKGGVGDWTVDESKLPGGLKRFSDEMRKRGLVPGIWMEFENIRYGSERYSEKFDTYNLKKDGRTIQNEACNMLPTKFLDFRNPEVTEYLSRVVIEFLKENNIGYLKVDYNANVGIGCDSEDGLGEGLRLHMEGVCNFFKKIKECIPDIIIENCASGGARLEPKMMSVSAMSSFSDAHECAEVPVIAANMHYLISPRQSQVWCVLKNSFDENHMRYVIASGFLGRLCWSGYIDKLSKRQFDMMLDAEKFYEKVCHIIASGRSRIYRTDCINNRKPMGTQAVVRYSEDRREALVVCHFMKGSKEMEIELDGEYIIAESLYGGECSIIGNKLVLNGEDMSAEVLYLSNK
ncbi:MAG: glycoside hydrolase family 36 protein [Monoglobaceae bacterium]